MPFKQWQIQPSRCCGSGLVFGFRIDDSKHFSLIVKDNTCELQEGENPDGSTRLALNDTPCRSPISHVRADKSRKRTRVPISIPRWLAHHPSAAQPFPGQHRHHVHVEQRHARRVSTWIFVSKSITPGSRPR